MEVLINNQLHTLPSNATILKTLNELFPGSLKGVAVAVNNEVITRSDWDIVFLKSTDKVSIIKATQGG